MLSWWILAVILLSVLIKYHWSRRRLYQFANSLPGPPTLPIMGNGLSFLGETKDLLGTVQEMTRAYRKPLRIWLGSDLLVYFSDPGHAERILSWKGATHKHDLYELMKIYLGEGLVATSGEKWKGNRKLIQPLFNSRYVRLCAKNFNEKIGKCMGVLEERAGGGDFNIRGPLHACCADIIGESLLGVEVNALNGENLGYVEAMRSIYDLIYGRIMKPWFRSDLLFALFGSMKEQTRTSRKINEFFGRVISEHRMRDKLGTEEDAEKRPIIDQMVEGFRRASALPIGDQEIVDHMLTLYLASEDTITETTAFLCLLLGMYPQYQTIAANEIRSVFGEEPRPVEYDDLARLPYTEMCIKDVTRLFPIAPYILRKTTEDFEIDGMVVPEGCAIVVGIFELHRDPNQWERPNQFHPNHFLAEAVSKRHPCSFVPFSSGPRSCIGKHFAMTLMKLLVANVLQRFEIEAEGSIEDIELKADISVRAVKGYNVRLKRRAWID